MRSISFILELNIKSITASEPDVTLNATCFMKREKLMAHCEFDRAKLEALVVRQETVGVLIANSAPQNPVV